MKIEKIISTMFISLLFLGIIIVRQWSAAAYRRNITNEDAVMRLAYEIIETSNSNFNLQNEVDRLERKNDTFVANLQDREGVRSDVDERLSNYRMINGVDEIAGAGIEITVDGSIITEEMIDLINGIRNAKPKAIGIDGARVVYRSYFVVNGDTLEVDDRKTSMPFRVQVVGDPDVLRKSLDRPGGILDVVAKNSFGKVRFSVTTQDSLVLPSYDGPINFRFSREINS